MEFCLPTWQVGGWLGTSAAHSSGSAHCVHSTNMHGLDSPSTFSSSVVDGVVVNPYTWCWQVLLSLFGGCLLHGCDTSCLYGG